MYEDSQCSPLTVCEFQVSFFDKTLGCTIFFGPGL